MKITTLVTLHKFIKTICADVLNVLNTTTKIQQIDSYVNFTSKDIQFNQFILCKPNTNDEITEPVDYGLWIITGHGNIDVTWQQYMDYKKAKEAQIFKGWYISDTGYKNQRIISNGDYKIDFIFNPHRTLIRICATDTSLEFQPQLQVQNLSLLAMMTSDNPLALKDSFDISKYKS